MSDVGLWVEGGERTEKVQINSCSSNLTVRGFGSDGDDS